jgi:hypothetical protein
MVFILLGKHNFENFYHKNHSAKQIQAYAKKRGLKVIAATGECGSWVKMDVALDGMIHPLANAKQKHTEETHERLSLWDKIKLNREARNHASGTSNGEGVPPVFHLKAGERVTHILINANPPNEKS